MDARSVAPEATPRKALEELLEAAAEAAAYLRRRERHLPPEMLDGHETRHRLRLERAVEGAKGER